MNARQVQLESPEDETPAADHRNRVARERRARMRERLIAATMDVYSKSTGGRRPVIEDVIRTANVSRGTFYKYFDTLDAVLTEIGHSTASEMLLSFDRLFGPLDVSKASLNSMPSKPPSIWSSEPVSRRPGASRIRVNSTAPASARQ